MGEHKEAQAHADTAHEHSEEGHISSQGLLANSRASRTTVPQGDREASA
jgi:hypothetical protein